MTATPDALRHHTTVAFVVADTTHVRVVVYDALGRQVALLADAPDPAGRPEVAFDAESEPAGTFTPLGASPVNKVGMC